MGIEIKNELNMDNKSEECVTTEKKARLIGLGILYVVIIYVFFAKNGLNIIFILIQKVVFFLTLLINTKM